MSIYELQHHFPFDVEPADDGKVTLSMQIEAIHVKTFLTMLESLAGLFRIVNNKAKVSLSYTRLEKNLSSGQAYYQKYFEDVVNTFKILRRTSELTTRELISETLIEIKQLHPNSSYNSVKQILTKSGELKKNGYYKK